MLLPHHAREDHPGPSKGFEDTQGEASHSNRVLLPHFDVLVVAALPRQRERLAVLIKTYGKFKSRNSPNQFRYLFLPDEPERGSAAVDQGQPQREQPALPVDAVPDDVLAVGHDVEVLVVPGGQHAPPLRSGARQLVREESARPKHAPHVQAKQKLKGAMPET